jgi:hypothetical protein
MKSPRNIWERALRRYKLSEQACRYLESQRLDDLAHQEERINRLADRIEAALALAAVPAPDLPAVSVKLEALYRDVFLEDRDLAMPVAALVMDVRRLLADGSAQAPSNSTT